MQPDELFKLLDLEFYGNTVLNWAIAALAFLATFTVLPLVKGYVAVQRRKWAQTRELPTALDLIALLISKTSRLFLLTAALYMGSLFLEMPVRAHRVFEGIIVISCWLQVGLWIVSVVRFFIEHRHHKQNGGTDALAAGSITILMFVAHLIVWAIVILLALGNLGVNITALVAGLGVGGIAIALAVQTVLGDLLASLAIAFDKPFHIGDTLGIDDYTGTVEDIGIKSTRLRSVSGEQLIISNADILRSRVRNLGRMPEQRALLVLNVDYETARDKLKQLPALIEKAINSQPNTRFTQAVLKNFGTTGLEYEVIYYVLRPKEYARTVDVVNQQILAALAEVGVRFSYPTRMAYQPGAGASASKASLSPLGPAGDAPGNREQKSDARS